ncbi:MAG: hypothetical protein ABR879_08360 [Methanomassiliicoccales archaeon]|jgi:hypothetical protein
MELKIQEDKPKRRTKRKTARMLTWSKLFIDPGGLLLLLITLSQKQGVAISGLV